MQEIGIFTTLSLITGLINMIQFYVRGSIIGSIRAILYLW